MSVPDNVLPEADIAPNMPMKASNSRTGEIVPGLSFFEEVRRRVQRMQQELQAREQTISTLHVQIKSLELAQRHDLHLRTAVDNRLT